MEDRQKRLLGLIEQAMGKAAYSGNIPEEGEDDEAVEDPRSLPCSLPQADSELCGEFYGRATAKT